MLQINYCGISGGKDSTATALWLIYDSGLPKDSLRFTFCDTHNEDRVTYDYIAMLSEKFIAWGAPGIVRLEPERGFFDLAKWKKRFPTRQDIEVLLQAGHDVTLYSGTRRDESADREALQPESFDYGFGCKVKRPILTWTREDVFL